MNADSDILTRLPDRNPFCSRATRPGALKYEFVNGSGPAALIERLATTAWWGEIVGPHGSGKSTLVCSLLAPLQAAGRSIRQYTLHSGEKRVPLSGAELKSWDSSTQVIVDGYEQLGGWNRQVLKRICKHQGAGLLVTAHQSAGLPLLLSTSVTLELAQRLVSELVPQGCSWVATDDVARSFDRHRGNLREVFFELYDVYESRRRR